MHGLDAWESPTFMFVSQTPRHMSFQARSAASVFQAAAHLSSSYTKSQALKISKSSLQPARLMTTCSIGTCPFRT